MFLVRTNYTDRRDLMRELGDWGNSHRSTPYGSWQLLMELSQWLM